MLIQYTVKIVFYFESYVRTPDNV